MIWGRGTLGMSALDDLSYRLDGNSVDLDHELALMAENRVRYNALLRALSHHFSNLQSVLTERP